MAARQKLHAAIFAVVMIALVAGGWTLASTISTSPAATLTTTILPAHTLVVHKTRVVKKVVRGKVIRLKSGVRVVKVPLVVIHVRSCHRSAHTHCVRRVVVPAHIIRLRPATVHQAVAIATPSIPVTIVQTVIEPAKTITMPAQTITQTQTQTQTQTETTTNEVTITVTVTVPINPGDSTS